MTPIFACLSKSISIVKVLMDAGADITLTDSEGKNPLMYFIGNINRLTALNDE